MLQSIQKRYVASVSANVSGQDGARLSNETTNKSIFRKTHWQPRTARPV